VAQFSFELPDELIPALIAEYWIVSNAGATQAETPEDYFRESIIETVRQRAKIYKVGPYFEGVIQPKFLMDGTPNPEYNTVGQPPEIEDGSGSETPIEEDIEE
jgi:hypothetical protein